MTSPFSHLPLFINPFYSVSTLIRCDITICILGRGPASLSISESLHHPASSRLGKGRLRSHHSNSSLRPLCRTPARFASAPRESLTTPNFARGVLLLSDFFSRNTFRRNIHSMATSIIPASPGAPPTPVSILSTVEASKRAAAYKAVEDHFDPSYRYVGIGSGSTVVYVVEAIVAQGTEITSKMRFIPTGE